MIKECLTKDEIIISFIIRKNVFIEEENINYLDEFDLLDINYHNFLIYYNNKAVGTARYEINNNIAHIGRVCVLKEYRHLGLASKLIKYLEEDIIKNNANKIIIASQLKVMNFYKQLGYIEEGNIFLDAGIEHKMMFKNIM